MSPTTRPNRWTVTPGPGGDAPFRAVAPDGSKHGEFGSWTAAYLEIAPKNSVLCEQELSERGAELVEVFLEMKQRGATRVSIEYSGSGDSGSFGELRVEGAKALADERHALERYFGELLEARYAGWENNEGGSGEFTVDLTASPLRVEHTHNTYYEDYETSEHSTELGPPAPDAPPSRSED